MKRAYIIAIVVVVTILLLVGLGLGVYFGLREKPNTTNPNNPAPIPVIPIPPSTTNAIGTCQTKPGFVCVLESIGPKIYITYLFSNCSIYSNGYYLNFFEQVLLSTVPVPIWSYDGEYITTVGNNGIKLYLAFDGVGSAVEVYQTPSANSKWLYDGYNLYPIRNISGDTLQAFSFTKSGKFGTDSNGVKITDLTAIANLTPKNVSVYSNSAPALVNILP